MTWPGDRVSQRENPSALMVTLQGLSRELELRVWAMADALRQGDSPSTIPGRGIEVSGVREYQHGDEARGIDWRVTARRDRLFVKEFSQERELPVLVMLNLTRSLWAGRGDVKAARAMEVASLLAAYGLRSGDRVGLLLSGGGEGRTVPPGNGRMQLPRILRELLTDPEWKASVPLAESLIQARFLLHERARVFLVGDFQFPESELEDLRPGLRALGDRHHLIPVRVKDAEEGGIPHVGSVLLKDPSTGGERVFPGSRGGNGLRALLAKAEEGSTSLFRSLGLQGWEVDVDDPLVEALRKEIYRTETRSTGPNRVLPGREGTGA